MDDEIDLRDIFHVLWKRRLLIIGVFLIAVMVAGVVSFTMPSVYRASCIVALGNFEDPLYTTQASASEIMLKDDFILDVIDQLNLSMSPSDFGALKDSIKIEPVKDSNRLIQISVETLSPGEAKRIVEEIARLFANRSDESYNEQKSGLVEKLAVTSQLLDSVKEDINKTRELLEFLENGSGLSPIDKELTISRKIEYLRSAESLRLSLFDRYLDQKKNLTRLRSVEVVQSAREPVSPVKPQRSLIIAVAGMLGLMVGIFAAFLRESLGRPAE